jgi:predicted RNA binding protein YcfA (HicA-like mRNA interferase family)
LGKLRVLSGRQVCQILEARGFVFVRQRGSHLMMKYVDDQIELTIPVPDHEEIRIGTLVSIIRQSRLPRELFETA